MGRNAVGNYTAKDIELISCSSTRKEGLLPTYVMGLDDLLRGGFQLPGSSSDNGLVVLLKGAPGTGKTTMAMQLAMGANRWTDEELKNAAGPPSAISFEKARIYTCEQRREELSRLITDRLKLTVPVAEVKEGDSLPAADIAESRVSGEEVAAESFVEAENTEWQKEIINRIYDNITPLPRTPATVVVNPNAVEQDKKTASKISGGEWWTMVNEHLTQPGSDSKIRLVVLDGLNLISTKNPAFDVVKIEGLIKTLRQRSMVSVLVYEGDQADFKRMDYLVDMIIELDAKEFDGPPKYYLQRLCIQKSRFQQSVLGWHQYKIRDLTGINIFPSLHFHIHSLGLLNERIGDSMISVADAQEKPPQKLNDTKSQLGHILNNLKKGSSTVVLGARRTWKTMLTLDFLRAGSERNENVLLVSLMDNQDTITAEPKELCKWHCLGGKDEGGRESCKQCYANMYLLHFRPGCISSSEFFHHLHKRLEIGKQIGKPISRLVFWDLTQLEYRFPLLANDRLFVPALMDYLKNSRGADQGITSVFMGAANTQISKAASAIADNVVFCWWDKYEGVLGANDEKTTKSGFTFHVDRLEGRPENHSLFFLPEKEEVRKKLNNNNVIPIADEAGKTDTKFGLFAYAGSMREHIWAMQGLEVYTDR